MAAYLEFSDTTQLQSLLALSYPADNENTQQEKSFDSERNGDEEEESSTPARLEGRRLALLTAGLFCYGSLTDIWTCFLIIWAKLSDFLGRKLMLLGAVTFFLAFSAACGAAQTSIQLIVCRAFQGIGGAGIFSMVPIIVAEMVEPAKYGAYNGIVSLAIAFSFLLGPLFGGAITDGTTWRWIFFINLPVGAVALAFIYVAMPAGFPDPAAIKSPESFGILKKNVAIRNRIDYPGFFLLLASCVLLIVSIEEAGTTYSWSSALVIACLVIAIILFILFVVWQWYLDYSKSEREPIFPWEFVKTRVLMGMYLNALLSGIPFVTLVIELPLRFESINGKSGLDAGVDILPFTSGLGFASAITGAFTGKGRVPVIVVLFVATSLQILGMGLLYSVPVDMHLPARLYVFQIFAGMGTGLSLTTLLNTVPSVVEGRVLAVAMGGVTQLRILGGALGTSIATDLLNSTARNLLSTELPADTLASILKDVSLVKTLSAADQVLVRTAFAEGYHKQLVMMLGFCVAEVVALVLMWEWPMRRLE